MRLMIFAGVSMWVSVVACSSSNSTPPPGEQAGQACASPAECYPGLQEAGVLRGAVQCITKVQGGYCSHLCQSDADCCAVPGECRSGFKQVCAPFENTSTKYCFLSCEGGDVAAAPNGGTTDPSLYCQHFASAAFGCRSTGGGGENRKVCSP